MRSLPGDFLTTANSEANRPVWLYRIAVDDDTDHDVFLAEWDSDVSYYKDDSTAQTYSNFAIRHLGIGANLLGQIDNVVVQIGNVSAGTVLGGGFDRFQAFMEAYDGLVGRKITIRLAFAEHLDDPDAYVEHVFYVDSASNTDTVCELRLSSRIQIAGVTVPGRTFSRFTCQWRYKGEGCWRDAGGVWTAPGGFAAGSPDSCGKTYTECQRHNNLTRFGGFPSVPFQRTYEG